MAISILLASYYNSIVKRLSQQNTLRQFSLFVWGYLYGLIYGTMSAVAPISEARMNF